MKKANRLRFPQERGTLVICGKFAIFLYRRGRNRSQWQMVRMHMYEHGELRRLRAENVV